MRIMALLGDRADDPLYISREKIGVYQVFMGIWGLEVVKVLVRKLLTNIFQSTLAILTYKKSTLSNLTNYYQATSIIP